MKNIVRNLLLSAACATALLAFTVSSSRAAETHDKNEKRVVSSVRPSGDVKKVDLPAHARITFEQALKAATAAVPGAVVNGELEVEDGNLMYSFEIVTAKHTISEVEIDAGTGAVLDIDVD